LSLTAEAPLLADGGHSNLELVDAAHLAPTYPGPQANAGRRLTRVFVEGIQ
jgi:hypothetical protein